MASTRWRAVAHEDPCTTNAFIGDYFGLAISGGNIYALMVSTHYPSDVQADGGGPVYYQQQVLATVPHRHWDRLLNQLAEASVNTAGPPCQQRHRRRHGTSMDLKIGRKNAYQWAD